MTDHSNHSEPVPKTTPDLRSERVEKLKALFPDCVTEGRVDFDCLRAALGDLDALADDEAADASEAYTFTWAGKQEAFRTLQEPSAASLKPVPEDSVNWHGTRHLFIEGENLDVLKLLYKSYVGKVKMIYIDPPYNTGNDFIYRDDYREPRRTYMEKTGQMDAAGNLLKSNPESSGRYHSRWLSMMYPRLFLARQLLRADGVMFVSIDDHELHNLRMLMNEIFGETCFKNCIVFRRGIKNVQAQFDTVDSLTVGHEYVVMYARSPDTRFRKLEIPLDKPRPGGWNNHWRGTDRPTMRYELFGITPEYGQWRWSKERSLNAITNYERMLEDLGVNSDEVTSEQIDAWYENKTGNGENDVDLLRLSDKGKPEHYVPPSDTKLGSDLWTDLSPRGRTDLDALFDNKVFSNPKPVALIKRMLDFTTSSDSNDIVLDFFAGSCSTAHAVLEKNLEDNGNRQFIMVQYPEALTGDLPGTEFENIAEIGKERLRRAIRQLEVTQEGKSDIDLGFRVFTLAPSTFHRWRRPTENDLKGLEKQLVLFDSGLREKAEPENALYEIVLKLGYSLNAHIKLLELEQNRVYEVMEILDEDKVDESSILYICLEDEIYQTTVEGLPLDKDTTFVCRDTAVDDSQKINLSVQCLLKTI
jgi:adenine-specific DNA-methyltransferase